MMGDGRWEVGDGRWEMHRRKTAFQSAVNSLIDGSFSISAPQPLLLHSTSAKSAVSV